MLVVVLDVLADYGFEVTSSEDERAVEALAADSTRNALADGVCPRRPDGSLDDPDSIRDEDGVKDRLNFVSRSRMRNLTPLTCSASTTEMFRACWVTQSVAGWAVTPTIRTRHVSWWMKKRT